jgi:2-polyprenyl-3-methyl-5-hydroxy-6-metoxy-1,4-benzoquinol methylase
MKNSLDQIPRGNTARGVNRAIIEYLQDSGKPRDGQAMLDIPCGRGSLVSTLRDFFPKALVKGCDVGMPASLSADDFALVDASRPFRVFAQTKFDVLLSVSGVMEFDNTLQFFEQCKNHLKDGGTFVVTNDNVVSLRDRLSYFWLGKVRPYHMFAARGQPTWKVIPIYNLVRLLQDAGFKINEIRYASVRAKDYLMLPLALLVYPVQFIYMQFAKHRMPVALRHAMYPFSSLLYRHYLVVCEKPAESPPSSA